MEFILNDDVDYNQIKVFNYYPGLDHLNDNIDFQKSTSIQELINHATHNPNIKCFNTLGFFKNKCNISTLCQNQYINSNNKHGLFVKNINTITDDMYFDILNNNISIDTHVTMDGFFQFDDIYLNHKVEIMKFIESNKDSHYIQTDTNHRFLIKDIIDEITLPSSKIYDIVIHIRLGDFNGRPDFIEYEYYEALFQTIDFTNKRICMLLEPTNNKLDTQYLNNCMIWFKNNTTDINSQFIIESNDLMTDFNIMKQTPILICSMSTLAWSAAYFSKKIQKCYMPNYDFSKIRKNQHFKKPIENTIFYNVHTTNTCME